ncbi:histidine-rich glycoprotein-like, partial [Phymastichus coffea]|uniref:histidine-rich glycoprotein-like n=1 Tax=Phymastichus coffea TaxID=108790 RepID=UPI00273AE8E5
MFSTTKSKLLLALASLALISLLLSAAEATRQPAPHHRHRHRHELQRLPSWKRDDYEEEYYNDNETEDEYDHDGELYSDESEEEQRDEWPSRHRNPHSRYESRYSSSKSRYHRSRHHDAAPHRFHAHHRARSPVAHHRRRYEDSGSSSSSFEDYEDMDALDNETHNRLGKHKRKRTNHRASRYDLRKDWRHRNDDNYNDEAAHDNGYDSDYEDEDEREEYASRARKRDRFRTGRVAHQDESPSRRPSSEWPKKMRHLANGSRLYHHESSWSKKRTSAREEAPPDEEDPFEQLWKDDDAVELDNDFYKNDDHGAPLKTYDDIIRRLTEDRATSTASTTTTTSTTPKTTKRNYRNIQLEARLRPDAFGNLRFTDSSQRNVSYRANIVLDHDGTKNESDYEDTQADANT